MASPNEHILMERLNDMMKHSGCYDYKKFNDQNIYNGTNVLHMNIKSIFYHFDYFHTFYITTICKV